MCSDPEKALRLARDMRLRAARIELGAYDGPGLDEALRLIRATGQPPL